ncbi:hypothetical protein DPEC_G00206570 [Dallia pectoralis]|uniref:Uncharacterized protein n=1 Tax=Dallia pectoralis TaxID=75939 RepID=A0ACC2G4M4_DALPE|nr:hypothetical protein DPEC_G00206570 [Dallia pectoralis]
MELTPLRTWDDFFPGSDQFVIPQVRDLTKWNNRVVNNLFYYQTNHLVFAVTVFLILGFLSPIGMLMGMAVVSLVFLGSVWAGENKAMIKDFKTMLNDFKKQNTILFVIAMMAASYFLMFLLKGIIVFVSGITFPLLLIFTHASLRFNKNTIWVVGLKNSPMGILLEALGQKEEILQKFFEFVEEKERNQKDTCMHTAQS